MQLLHLHDRRRNLALVLLLAGALLAAQLIGTMHRVVHSGLFQTSHAVAEAMADTSSAVSSWSAALSHSCTAFDAATLGDAMSTPVFAIAADANLYGIAQLVAFISWTAPVVACFSCRGPPLA